MLIQYKNLNKTFWGLHFALRYGPGTYYVGKNNLQKKNVHE